MMVKRLRAFVKQYSERIHLVVLVVALALLLAFFFLPTIPPWLIILALAVVIFVQAAVVLIVSSAASLGQRVLDSPTDEAPANLKELITRIYVTVDGLVRATEAINQVAVQQSEGTVHQAEVIRSTNAMLEDFLQLSERVHTQAQAMTQTAQQAAKVTQNGQAAIQQAIASMNEIHTQVEAIGETIVKLAALTRRIDEIITSVSEIATQSNLLALNASIEAARAGAQGRGFSVVANEVRSLSQQSTQSARQVRAILVEIQSAVKETVGATEVGMHGVTAGTLVTQEVGRLLEQLTDEVEASNDAVRGIYEVIRQQVDELDEVGIGMNRMDQITQQNLTNTRMMETVAVNLTRLATDLQEAVEQSEGLSSHAVPQYADGDSN